MLWLIVHVPPQDYNPRCTSVTMPIAMTLVRLSLALCLVLVPSPVRAEDLDCPSARLGDSDKAIFKACLKDARATTEQSRAAALYRAALGAAQRIYAQRDSQADLKWRTNFGDELVDYGTENCAMAEAMAPDAAREMLVACLALLQVHSDRLGQQGGGGSRAAQTARKRLDALNTQLADLEAQTKQNADPLGPGLQPSDKQSGESTPASPGLSPQLLDNPHKQSSPASPDPGVQPLVPPPSGVIATSPEPTTAVRRRVRPQNADPAPLAPPPRGLQAGVATSAALVIGSAVGVGLTWSMGQKAHARLEQPAGLTAADDGKSLCDVRPAPDGCQDLTQAKRGLAVSGVGLGLSLVTTAVFTGLLLRHRARARTNALMSPARGGFMAGIMLRF